MGGIMTENGMEGPVINQIISQVGAPRLLSVPQPAQADPAAVACDAKGPIPPLR